MFFRDKCAGCGRCRGLENDPDFHCFHGAREYCGKHTSAEDVIAEALRDAPFYKASGGGVTFSGGECMLQIDFLKELLRACKAEDIHTAVDTAGNVPFERFLEILPFTDLFLYDVKCINSEKHRAYTGVGNKLILENLKKLLESGKDIWIRIPVIGGVNDTDEDMMEIRSFLATYGKPKKIALLPYHEIGNHKYAALGKEATVFTVPSEEKMKRLNDIFL
jgi:pyruvate formate lyase activating enzyme